MIVHEKDEEKEEDYVYDVYYRDDSNEQGVNSGNVGSLVWFDDHSEYLDDDSDSELGDYADEDSNGNRGKADHV